MAGLLITRRPGEWFLIGDDVRVTVVEGQSVRLRIEAPADVVITRSEHHEGVRDDVAE